MEVSCIDTAPKKQEKLEWVESDMGRSSEGLGSASLSLNLPLCFSEEEPGGAGPTGKERP